MRKIAIGILLLIAIFLLLPEKSHQNMVKVYFHQKDNVVEMDFEEYIAGVVAAEMPSSFELEALKAQAVAARTYARRKTMQKADDPLHKGGDICTNSTHCQAYRPPEELKGGDRGKIRRAVSETKGQVALYNGELISAVFHSAAHGFTERSADVWGGDMPYLQSVESPWDADSPDYITEVKLTAGELCHILDIPRLYPLVGRITRSGAGGVMEMELAGHTFKGTELRSRLKLRSTCFTAEEDGDAVLFRVTGHGHGVGLSQWGAQGMAKAGCTYTDILCHYYKGIEISSLCLCDGCTPY